MSGALSDSGLDNSADDGVAKNTGVSDMLGISSSWFAMKGLSIRESIEKGFEMGFELVELGAAHKYEENAVETVMELRKKYPDKKFTIHALFPPVKINAEKTNAIGENNTEGPKNHSNARGHHYVLNLADNKEHEATIKCVKKMFDIADHINAEMIGIHGGYAGEVRFVEGALGFETLMMKNPIPLEEAKRNMTVIIQELVNMAEERGTKLAVEISPPLDCGPLMTNLEDFEWLFSNFKSKYLGLLLDVGHLHLSAKKEGYDLYEFLKKFKGKLFELHLHDIKDGRDHSAFGTGEIDFEKHVKIIGRAKLKKIPIVFEYNSSVTEQQTLDGKLRVEKLLAGR